MNMRNICSEAVTMLVKPVPISLSFRVTIHPRNTLQPKDHCQKLEMIFGRWFSSKNHKLLLCLLSAMRKDGYVTKPCIWRKRNHAEKELFYAQWMSLHCIWTQGSITTSPGMTSTFPFQDLLWHSLVFPGLLWHPLTFPGLLDLCPFLTLLDLPWLAAPSLTFPDLLWPLLPFSDFLSPALMLTFPFFNLPQPPLNFFDNPWPSSTFSALSPPLTLLWSLSSGLLWFCTFKFK